METFGTERGPVQSVASVRLSHRSPERKSDFVAPVGQNPVDITDLPGTVTRLPVLVGERHLLPRMPLPFAAQKIAQETPFFPAASGPHQHRKGVLAYQKVEALDIPVSSPFLPLSVRA